MNHNIDSTNISLVYACVCVLSGVWLVVNPWTVAHWAPPWAFAKQGISQARILECVAISFSRWSSWPRDWTWVFCISCLNRWIHYHCTTWEAVFTQQFSKNHSCDGKTYQNTSLETSPEAASCAVEQKCQAQLQLLCSCEPGQSHRQHETSECGYWCCPSPWGRAPGSPPFLSQWGLTETLTFRSCRVTSGRW